MGQYWGAVVLLIGLIWLPSWFSFVASPEILRDGQTTACCCMPQACGSFAALFCGWLPVRILGQGFPFWPASGMVWALLLSFVVTVFSRDEEVRAWCRKKFGRPEN